MYTSTREGQRWAACSFLAPMASCRGTCRCMSLNLTMIVFWRAFFPISFLASHSFCSSFNFRCRVCHGMFVIQCNENIMFSRGILFYSKWPFGQRQHISKKNNLFHWRAIHLWVEWSRSKNRKLEQISARSANEWATPGWPASKTIK